MKIRKAQPKDASDIRALILRAHESNRIEDFDNDGWVRFLGRNEIPTIKDRIKDGAYLILCAVIDGRIAGVIGIYNNDYVYYLMVDPGHRNKGVATKLWEVARDICTTRSEVDTFYVKSSELALPVYESFGFKVVGARKSMNGVFFTEMELSLQV